MKLFIHHYFKGKGEPLPDQRQLNNLFCKTGIFPSCRFACTRVDVET